MFYNFFNFLQQVNSKDGSMAPIVKIFPSSWPSSESITMGVIEFENNETCEESSFIQNFNIRSKKKRRRKNRKKKVKIFVQRGFDSNVSDSTASSANSDNENCPSNSSEVKDKPSHHSENTTSFSEYSINLFHPGLPPIDTASETSVEPTSSILPHPTRPPNDAHESLCILACSGPTVVTVASFVQNGLPVPNSDLTVLVESNPHHYIVPPEHLPSYIDSSNVDAHHAPSPVLIEGSQSPSHMLNPSSVSEEKTDSGGELDENEQAELSEEQNEESQQFSTPMQVSNSCSVNNQLVRTISNCLYFLVL